MINMSYPNSYNHPGFEYPLYSTDEDGSYDYDDADMKNLIMDGSLQRRIHSVICSNSTYSYGYSMGFSSSNQWAPFYSTTVGGSTSTSATPNSTYNFKNYFLISGTRSSTNYLRCYWNGSTINYGSNGGTTWTFDFTPYYNERSTSQYEVLFSLQGETTKSNSTYMNTATFLLDYNYNLCIMPTSTPKGNNYHIGSPTRLTTATSTNFKSSNSSSVPVSVVVTCYNRRVNVYFFSYSNSSATPLYSYSFTSDFDIKHFIIGTPSSTSSHTPTYTAIYANGYASCYSAKGYFGNMMCLSVHVEDAIQANVIRTFRPYIYNTNTKTYYSTAFGYGKYSALVFNDSGFMPSSSNNTLYPSMGTTNRFYNFSVSNSSNGRFFLTSYLYGRYYSTHWMSNTSYPTSHIYSISSSLFNIVNGQPMIIKSVWNNQKSYLPHSFVYTENTPEIARYDTINNSMITVDNLIYNDEKISRIIYNGNEVYTYKYGDTIVWQRSDGHTLSFGDLFSNKSTEYLPVVSGTISYLNSSPFYICCTANRNDTKYYIPVGYMFGTFTAIANLNSSYPYRITSSTGSNTLNLTLTTDYNLTAPYIANYTSSCSGTTYTFGITIRNPNNIAAYAYINVTYDDSSSNTEYKTVGGSSVGANSVIYISVTISNPSTSIKPLFQPFLKYGNYTSYGTSVSYQWPATTEESSSTTTS